MVFNANRVYYFEAAGWRAYYDRKWLRLLRLTIALCQEQFHIPFPVSLLAAYYITRGAAAWAPLDHDAGIVAGYYDKFYRLARRYSGLQFDPARVGRLELRYWDDHRRLVGKPDKTAFLQTLVELHSATFGLPPEQVRESAEWRLQAANTVDLITSGNSTDVTADWAKIEECLRRCYRSIQREMDGAPERR